MKIAAYVRVSTEDQAKEGYSLEVQREYLEAFASREGYNIFKVYCGDGISAYSTRREALQQLLKDAKQKRFDLVLVYKIDRFSRNLKDLLNLVDELSACGVGFKSATEPFDSTTSAGKLMFQQLGSFAEFERNRISGRVFPGMIKGVQQGNWQGARFSPFGYTYNKAKKLLEIERREADIVKLIYTMYLAGKSTQDIAEYLNKKKYQTRTGKQFYNKFICDILKDRIYTGKIVWNKKHYDKNQKTKKYYKYIKNDPSKVIVAQLVQNDRLKQYRCMTVTLPKAANFPNFSENAKIDSLKLRNKLEENHKKQSKLTDAYLENLLGEDVFRGKIEELRKGEDELKILLAGYELRELESERSEGYINRVKDFLDGYDEAKSVIDFATKKAMAGLLFKNIKIAPLTSKCQGARPQKRISFSLFPPF